jgi:hypothetical protein
MAPAREGPPSIAGGTRCGSASARISALIRRDGAGESLISRILEFTIQDRYDDHEEWREDDTGDNR